jgi:NAD-dependent deacetylase
VVLVSVLDKYQSVLFWIGAGLSQASGVRPPPAHDRVSFLERPEEVWADYQDWRDHLLRCQPNSGHELLARIQRTHPQTRIITLNQDGLLRRAGCQALELHGSVWESRCFQCDRSHCDCQARQRPNVVWMGEELPEDRVEQARTWLAECDCLVTVGVSGSVPPAGSMPLEARQAYRIEINPAETLLSAHHDECWRGPAQDLLGKLFPSDSHRDR